MIRLLSLSLFIVLAFLASDKLEAQIRINEVCSDNETIILDEFGESADWVELYNPSDDEVTLSGWHLSDDTDDLFKWEFPETTIAAKGFLLLFASNKNINGQNIHTNFKLSADGESLTLLNPNDELVDKLIIPAIAEDISYGLSGEEHLFFNTPTPNEANATDDVIRAASIPQRVEEGYFFEQTMTMNLTCSTPGCQIFYTIDGSEPDNESKLYTTPISIDTTTCVRSRSIAPNFIDSDITTHTIFIGTDHSLPIVCLSAEPDDYFSHEKGILVDGPNGEPNFPYFGSNYWSEEKVKAHLEYFENGERQLDQNIDTRVHGGTNARTKPQKPIRLIAKEKYGFPHMDYPFFEDRESSKHKRLILRNASGDFNDCQLRDAFISRYISESDIYLDVLTHRPAAMYINGAYYGIINIREKSDEHYLANLYELDLNKLDLLEEDTFVVQGDFTVFDEMYDYVISNDLQIEANYTKAKSFFDIENIVDNFVVQTGLNNNDSFANNIKFWRERKEGAKWRYILFDLDLALSLRPWSKYDYDLFLEKMVIYNGENKHVNIFQAFLANTAFKNYFLNRHADLFNTVFRTDIFQAELEESISEIDHEMRKHLARWPTITYDQWQVENLPVLFNHIDRRPDFANQYLMDFFNLNKTVDLDLSSSPQEGGKIKINTITPELPWPGTYFDGVPVTLTAIPNPGYRFSHWESSAKTLDQEPRSSIEVNFAQNEEIIARYTKTDSDQPYIENVWWDGQTVQVRIGVLATAEIGFSVYDALGRNLYSASPIIFEPGLYTQQIPLDALANGAYFISIGNGSNEFSQPFIVTR